MIYEFDDIELTCGGKSFTVSGDFEVDEAPGFGLWNQDIEIGNIQFSNITDEDGYDVLNYDEKLIPLIEEYFIKK